MALKNKKENFSEWYTELVSESGAHLADIRYGIQGAIVETPWAVKIIRAFEAMFEKEVEADGHEPMLFPSIVPEAYIKKEKEHVAGFAPELYWVTEGGGKKLDEKFYLRPTGESQIFPMYSIWLRSWNQLPDDRVLLFKLYSMPFTVDSPTGKTEQSISYVGPLVQKSTPVADVYLTGDGKIVAHNTHGIFVLGADNMGERMCRKMKNSALQINHAGALPPVYCADLKLVLRNDLMLANSPTEIENCAKLGILYNRIIPFDTLQTESIKFYSEPARLIIPKELQSYAIIFLPKSFDPNGIRRIR